MRVKREIETRFWRDVNSPESAPATRCLFLNVYEVSFEGCLWFILRGKRRKSLITYTEVSRRYKTYLKRKNKNAKS